MSISASDEEVGDGDQGRRPQINIPHSVDVAVELDGLIYIYIPVAREIQEEAQFATPSR